MIEGSFLRNEPNFLEPTPRGNADSISVLGSKERDACSAELAGLAEVVARMIQVRLHEAVLTRPRRRGPLVDGMPEKWRRRTPRDTPPLPLRAVINFLPLGPSRRS
jgi:hypothetical protein